MSEYSTETIIWVALCIIVGVIAKNKGRSFFGFFLLSMVLSPLVGGIAVLVAKNRIPKQVEVVNHTSVVHPVPHQEDYEYDLDYDDAIGQAEAIRQFKDLLDDGVITQEEFEEKKRQILGS